LSVDNCDDDHVVATLLQDQTTSSMEWEQAWYFMYYEMWNYIM